MLATNAGSWELSWISIAVAKSGSEQIRELLRTKYKADDDTTCHVFACWVAPRMGGYAGVVDSDEKMVEMLICSKRIDVKAEPILEPAETLPEFDHAAFFYASDGLPSAESGGEHVGEEFRGTHMSGSVRAGGTCR